MIVGVMNFTLVWGFRIDEAKSFREDDRSELTTSSSRSKHYRNVRREGRQRCDPELYFYLLFQFKKKRARWRST